jgi:glycoside hydrolase-like protein
MRLLTFTLAAAAFLTTAYAYRATQGQLPAASARNHIGFDANEYPGDDLLPALRKQFAFTGYWLNNPPGADHNPWAGKRDILLRNGFGFLVAANGRLDKEILKAQKSGKKPATLGAEDAAFAVAAALREGFPARTILFLDQEEGGRLLPEQAEYLLGWTEGVARTTYRPGVYASGQPVDDGKGPGGRPATITTIQDIRAHVTAAHLHEIAFWVAQDACPPAPGCVIDSAQPPVPDLSGTLDADAWQFAQSPRRKSFTKACGATYSRDGNCSAPGLPQFDLDLNASASPDPSHGR